jgi:hypothetical protein
MADAVKIAEVSRTEVVVVEPAKVILELTLEEADALVTITGSVAGCPQNSPRKHFDSIRIALQRATGVEYEDTEARKCMRPTTHIDFAEYDRD